jgi:nicotinate phosphoribosyltransferase
MSAADGTPGDLALFTDLYELTMVQGYLETGHDPTVTFDLCVRSLPRDYGFVVAAGLDRALEYLSTLSFDDDALSFLADRGFRESLLGHLAEFTFTGEVRALPEGTVAFPHEPLLEVTAPISEAQLFETLLLNQVGYQSLVATKAARMRDAVDRAGAGQSLVEFGSRRAHGTDAGLLAARAAYVGGFDGTSNVAAARAFDLPAFGTMAHSWVQSFPTERAAFEAFVDVYGEDSILLIDTYDTLAGAETAAAVADDRGVDLAGVRIDSGDLAGTSRAVSEVVGETDVFVTSGLDEYAIESFLEAGGVAAGFGPGTALVTGGDVSSLNPVYKLVAVERDGELRPTTKLSPGKVTYPGQKRVHRVERDGASRRDVLGLRSTDGPGTELLVEVMTDGSLVADRPTLSSVRDRTRRQVEALPATVRSLRSPETYRVTVAEDLASTTERVRADLQERA